MAPQVPAQFHGVSLPFPLTLGPGAYAWFSFASRGWQPPDRCCRAGCCATCCLGTPRPKCLWGRKLGVSHGTEGEMIQLARARNIRDRVASLPIGLN